MRKYVCTVTRPLLVVKGPKWPQNQASGRNWSPRPDSNRGPFPYQGNALPPELRGRGSPDSICSILWPRFMPTIDDVLAAARRRLDRVTPEQAAAEQSQGALLVDTRTSEQRARDGVIPAALVIDRTVLEWRLDPTSPTRLLQANGHDVRVILICAQGYSSSLAAASLQDLGLVNATDVVGGFEAWKAAGLPVET